MQTTPIVQVTGTVSRRSPFGIQLHPPLRRSTWRFDHHTEQLVEEAPSSKDRSLFVFWLHIPLSDPDRTVRSIQCQADSEYATRLKRGDLVCATGYFYLRNRPHDRSCHRLEVLGAYVLQPGFISSP